VYAVINNIDRINIKKIREIFIYINVVIFFVHGSGNVLKLKQRNLQFESIYTYIYTNFGIYRYITYICIKPPVWMPVRRRCSNSHHRCNGSNQQNMLKFLTHKLRTQSINENLDKDNENRDSGTESDDEIDSSDRRQQNSHTVMEHQRLSSVSPADTGCSMESPAPDHQDAHSSEEELEVINSSVVQTRPTRSVPPEKRKWSQIVSGSTGTNAGGNEENVSRYGNLSPSTLGFANVVTVLEHSSDEEMTPSSLQIGMTTPVQFRTSPPLEAVKPGRRISSPPPKLVHYEASPRKRSRHRPHTLTQRPYLDFEKMQQLKTRSVAWKHNVDHSGELSVYCW